MAWLRRIVPLLSVTLALVVGGEMTDMLPCADTDCGVWEVLVGGDAPSPERGGPSDGPPAACLCHVTFVSTARLPAAPAPAPVGARPEPRAADRPAGFAPPVPHPPPRG